MRPGVQCRAWTLVRAVRRLAGVAVVVAPLAIAEATPPTFTGLGTLPGGKASGALAVSANGAVVVGYSDSPVGDRAIRWSRASGLQSLGTLPGHLQSRAVAASADGRVIVGFSRAVEGYHGFRWTASTGMTDIGFLPGGSTCVVGDVSDDGEVIVGYGDVVVPGGGVTLHAFRWTAQGGMVDLGAMPDGVNSYGAGISSDGSVIVGAADGASQGGLRAIRHVSGQGMQNLGAFPGSDGFTYATAVSGDGATVVGYGIIPAGFGAFRWTGGTGIEDLGKLPDAAFMRAYAVSGDGRIIVGDSETVAGDSAFLWTAARGVLDLNAYLAGRGLNLSGWNLISALGISADGLTIAGIGVHHEREEAWVTFLGAGQDLTAIEQLGKAIASDTSLSTPAGQACYSCHSSAAGFTNPSSSINEHGAVHRGAVPGRFGNRRPPTSAYAAFSPVLHVEDGTWVGGLFFDGRATGWTLGDPIAEQAMEPFLNPLEMNNPGPESVVTKVAGSNYASLFREVWGQDALPQDGGGDPTLAYELIARSIAAYQRSREVNPFNSKYDDYLAGRALLTAPEARGLTLFNGVAGCAACHPSAPGPNGEPPLFTDFTYDNIGIPANPENPFYSMPEEYNPDGAEFVDLGLGGFLARAGFPSGVFGPAIGKHKVPTLRNVDRRPEPGFVRAYGHNGFFKSLEEVVHFYNTRDVIGWPPPEVPQNVNIAELGNLHLSADDEAAIVAFLKTLTDRDVSSIRCTADFDNDGFVTGLDVDAFVLAFDVGAAVADIDRDGFVSGADFDLFMLAFDAGC